VTDRVVFSPNDGNDELDRLGAYDDFALTESRSVDLSTGLVSLGFITSAIRRNAWFWSVLALLGLLVGFGVYVERPHGYQASASLLLTLSPYENNLTAVVDNQAIAQTSAVAVLAMHELRVQQSISSFLGTYTATSVTDRVLTITAIAPSANQAVLRATAVSNAFLQFRADELHTQQNLVLGSLDQQITQASQRVSSIAAQISQVSRQAGSPAQQSQLSRLRAEQADATARLTGIQQAVTTNQTTTQPALTAALKNSQVLSVTPVPYSRKKKLAIYGGLGLVAGLALGLGIVIVRAVVSDRLRRRDDIAYVLDAPVKLSIRAWPARRWLASWPGRAAERDLDMRRVIAHLRGAVARGSHGPAGLIVVAVDNARVVAQAVAALGASLASQGNQVVTADLSAGTHLAHLLGVRSPGVHPVSRNGATFAIAVPGRDHPAPVGPLPTATWSTAPERSAEALLSSNTPADLLLTLATLDPALGAAHLTTWATDAVVVVTAGRSSAERIHSVGEMIRLAGARLDSVVLIRADKSDESLGLMRRPAAGVGTAVLGG
jgi:capsular polysaccharide biosynthesis protein